MANKTKILILLIACVLAILVTVWALVTSFFELKIIWAP